MPLSVTHTFVSEKVDGADATIVRPSNWNAAHALAGQASIAQGGTGAATAAEALTALGALPLSYLDTDGTLAANSDVKVASQKAVKTYADALIAANDAMVFKGVIDASANPNYPASNRGDTHRISVAGKIGGGSGPNVEVGDLLMALTDGTAAGTHATVGAQWNISQTNLDGAVIGPSSAADLRVATFNGTTGKLLADGGKTIAELALLAGPQTYTGTHTFGGSVRTNTYQDAVGWGVIGNDGAGRTRIYRPGNGATGISILATNNEHQADSHQFFSANYATTFATLNAAALTMGANIPVRTNAYQAVNGSSMLHRAGDYTYLSDPASDYRITFGAAADPANYYDNTSHLFRSRDHLTTTFATINATGLDVTGRVNATAIDGYYLGGIVTVRRVSEYLHINDNAGRVGLQIGPSTDPSNYYDNTNHRFRNRAGAAQATLTDTALTMGAGISVNTDNFRALNGEGLLLKSGDYTHLCTVGGTIVMSMGGTSDKTSYHNSDAHIFRNRAQSAAFATINATGILPGVDNTYSFGSASFRATAVHSVNGTIQTSHGPDKEWRALNEAEMRVAKRLGGLIGAYQWKHSIAEKGVDGARIHVGTIAQEVWAAFDAEGLDAARYGVWCEDALEAPVKKTRKVMREKTRKVQVEEEKIVVENGVAIKRVVMVERDQVVGAHVDVVSAAPKATAPKTTTKAATEKPAENPDPTISQKHFIPETEEVDEQYEENEPTGEKRQGIRYDQLYAFVTAASAQRLNEMEARLAALEA